MNERLKELAKQAGFEKQTHLIDSWECGLKELERFAELVRQDYIEEMNGHTLKMVILAIEREREACAALCTEMGNTQTNACFYDPWDCASAIRARGEE